MTNDQRPNAAEQMYFNLYCDSPGTRLSTARAEGRCDWPSGSFPATVTPERIANAFRSHLRSHPGIDHIVFTATARPHSRPYLEAHLVESCVHVKVAPLHHVDPQTRAIVHHLHAAITKAFDRARPMIEITPDTAGLNRWAHTVLAQAPADSANAKMARNVLGLLHGNHNDSPDTPTLEVTGELVADGVADAAAARPTRLTTTSAADSSATPTTDFDLDNTTPTTEPDTTPDSSL
ncbi:hypothetical protein AB0C34_17350 [Nocardia sp. NPDC049220]|uniref:hypothetical protein n=1 Tax=Nocardia sp. NPDC049220 TaxID=3155273 RepID=UPI0034005B0B